MALAFLGIYRKFEKEKKKEEKKNKTLEADL